VNRFVKRQSRERIRGAELCYIQTYRHTDIQTDRQTKQTNKQTNKQTESNIIPTPTDSVRVGIPNESLNSSYFGNNNNLRNLLLCIPKTLSQFELHVEVSEWCQWVAVVKSLTASSSTLPARDDDFDDEDNVDVDDLPASICSFLFSVVSWSFSFVTSASLSCSQCYFSYDFFSFKGKGKGSWICIAPRCEKLASEALRYGYHTVVTLQTYLVAFTRWRHQCSDSSHLILAYYSFIDPVRMKGWVGLVSWLTADGLPI